jgi:hypothetical protein
MRRRDVLRTFALVLAGPSTGVSEERAPRPDAHGTVEVDSIGSSEGSRPLLDTENEALLAFAEVLLGDRPLPLPARAEILRHIADRVRASGDTLALYREAAALLDRVAGAPFSTLAMRDRLDTVARYDLAPSRARVPRTDDVANSIRRRVAPDLIAGYYASPMGWAVVEYGIFPGRCGDLARYTRPER